MPASYPNSVKIFTTKTTGQTILASHINEPQDEITAIEQGLLQGLQHALFPNTDVGQDLGTATKRWRNLLVQKIASGITNATRLRVQEVGTSTWITVNADFDGTNWNREDTAQPAQAIEINSAKEVKYYRAAAGTNPITWTNIFTISTDTITAPQAVIGTDPGGTEVLRAQNLRAGSAVVGTDPGGTEALRAQNLRAGATTLTDTLTAPTVVAGTDPGGTETLRAQTLKAGNTTLTGTLTAPSAVVGTDPGGTEVLRAQNLRAGTTTITGTLSAPTVVAGTDPGGTESLRAGSARLNAPVLLGSVPQFTVDADPTTALQVATKQYADTKVSKTGDSMSGALVVGTDPGGTELLRAQSLRAGSGRVGSWRILGVINVTADTTTIQFTGLNLSPPTLLRLLGVVVNPTATASGYRLRVNGETNSLDWAIQYITVSGSTVSPQRVADTSAITYATAGFSASLSALITVTGGGLVMCDSSAGRREGTDLPVLSHILAVKNTAITALNSIELAAEVTGAIGAGSVFFLEYLAP
jgi:hypothetical protein